MNAIGSTLKDARTRKSLSLDEVHSKTKIHPHVLQFLEEEKFDKLPSPLFAKSFLRSYAEFLEINADELVKNFEGRGLKEPEQVLYIRPAEARNHGPRLRLDGDWLIVPLTIVGVLLLGGVLVYGSKYFRHLKPEAGPAAKSKAATAKTKTASAKLQIPKTLALSKEWIRHAELGNFPKISRRTPLELKIRALDNVWLRVTCDGKVLFQTILKKGAEELWSANDKIEIWTGNSSSMSFFVNGTSVGSPGKGVVKKMIVSHEGVRIPA